MMSSAKNAPPLPFPASASGSAGSSPETYGTGYYLRHCGLPYSRENPQWLEFFGRIADEIVRRLNPRKVLDVGCAHGFLVEALRDRGVEAYGVDVSEHAIGQVRQDIQPFCRVGSATEALTEHYDLITCIEVCEHLSEFEARSAIRNMTGHSDLVLFSSTPSDFSEPTDSNVRPILYWLRAFREFSFAPDLTFATNVVAPQAFLFRRSEQRPSDELLQRIANAKNEAVTQAAVNATPSQLRSELDRLRVQFDELKAELERTQDELSARTTMLNAVLNSRGWKLLNRYRNFRVWIMQHEFLRRLAFFLFR